MQFLKKEWRYDCTNLSYSANLDFSVKNLYN